MLMDNFGRYTGMMKMSIEKSIIYDGNWRIIRQSGQKDIRILNLPSIRQSTGYTCGVASLQVVLAYYDVLYREDILAGYACSSPDAGTHPANIVRAVQIVNGDKNKHFSAEIIQNAAVDDIKKFLDDETPVIIDIQAWQDEDNKVAWKDDWIDGHYVVATGYDDDNIYFEDPSILGSIGYIPQIELSDRWHDYEGADDYNPHTSVTTSCLMIVIRGEQPKVSDLIQRIE